MSIDNCAELKENAPHTVNVNTVDTKYNISVFQKMSNQVQSEYLIQEPDMKFFDFCRQLGSDWPQLANELGVPESDVYQFKADYCDDDTPKIMGIFKLWLQQAESFNLNNLPEI